MPESEPLVDALLLVSVVLLWLYGFERPRR